MDEEMSELAYDLLCIIHLFDYYISDDAREETYRQEVEFFKKKWLR